MRKLIFIESSFQELVTWQGINKTIFERLCRIIEETRKTPFSGIGKPEPLKFDKKGFWSKRINDEHRLIYKVTEETIEIHSCRDHY